MKNSFFNLKETRILFLIGSIALFAVCCKTGQSAHPAATTSSKKFLVPVKLDVAIAQAHWPTTTLDTLNLGYSIYTDKCASCHSYKKPQDFGVHEWWVIMRKMGRKANLTQNQDSLVLHYLLTKREAILGTSK